MNRAEQNEIIRQLLYQQNVDEETAWRADKAHSGDVELLDAMLSEINKQGTHYQYKADLMRQYVTDATLLNIIVKYLGNFAEQGISAELVSLIGVKGNQTATEKIIEVYNHSSDEVRTKQAAFFDNAFWRLKDKRYVAHYLEWLREPRIASSLPLTMCMLARWKVSEAEKYFIRYLDSGGEEEIVYTAIKALSHYGDDVAINKIEAMQKSGNGSISRFAKTVLERLKKHSHEKKAQS